MIKEITLVFTPFSLQDYSDDEVEINQYKNRAFSMWQNYVLHKKGDISYINEILPSNTNPISLGQLCLVSYLNDNGVKVNYVHGDYFIKKKNYTVQMFKDYLVELSHNSCMIGFYSMTPTINVTLDLMEYVKLRLPGLTTVLGGPHGTYTDVVTIEKYPFIDIVSRGEGEKTTLQIINAITEGNSNFCDISGITFRKDGVAVRNEDRDLICSKEIPSPDYSILPKDFNCLLTVMYARGCPYSCKFCAEGNIWRHKLRFRDPRIVAKEIQYVNNEWGQRVIHICDSEIDAAPKKLIELLDSIIELDLECKLTVNLRCDAYKRLTPELLKKMKKAGIVAYLIGVESASDYMLDVMGRRSNFLDFLKTIDLLNKYDAGFIFPGIMVGFPGETIDSIEKTKREFLKLLDEDRVDYFFPKVFIPYPGTDPFENNEEYKINLSNNWAEYARFGVKQPFTSNILSRENLEYHMYDFYKKIIEHYTIKVSSIKNV